MTRHAHMAMHVVHVHMRLKDNAVRCNALKALSESDLVAPWDVLEARTMRLR